MKFFIKVFFSKYDKNLRFLGFGHICWGNPLRKILIFCVVLHPGTFKFISEYNSLVFFGWTSHLTLFRAAHGWGWGGGGDKKPPLPKICRTHPAMMKLGTLISYLKKIQKIYKSRDTPLEFSWNQRFFTGDQQVLLYQQIQL